MFKSFLQSKEWEEFQKEVGNNPIRINGKLVEKLPLVLGQYYLYCPRPAFFDKKEFVDFIEKAKEIAKKEGAFFIRIEPIFEKQFDINDLKLRKVEERQPGQSLLVNLKLDKETILESMKSKARYNIKLAQKKGVKIRSSESKEDLKVFLNLAKETADRDKIKFRTDNYYEKMFEVLGPKKIIKIYTAKYENEDIASAIVLNVDETSRYLYGASSNKFRNIMAPYLLQWQAILDAKEKGYKYYDFWGVAPLEKIDSKFKIKDEKHPWVGITKFKLGFVPNEKNGYYEEYPGCFEISVGKKRYFLYSMFKKVV